MDITKGDWQIQLNSDGNPEYIFSDDFIICDFSVSGWPSDIIADKANAHLIASAPDSNKACKEAMCFLIDIHDLLMKHPEYTERAKALNASLWVAIDKAKGKGG